MKKPKKFEVKTSKLVKSIKKSELKQQLINHLIANSKGSK